MSPNKLRDGDDRPSYPPTSAADSPAAGPASNPETNTSEEALKLARKEWRKAQRRLEAAEKKAARTRELEVAEAQRVAWKEAQRVERQEVKAAAAEEKTRRHMLAILEKRAKREARKQQAREAAAERPRREKTTTKMEQPTHQKRRVSRRESDKSRDVLKKEIADLRGSYYLSGARKKIDVRTVQPFGEVVELIKRDKRRLGTDYDRLYTLWQALATAPSDAPMIEIGVYRGGSTKFIAESLRRMGRTPTVYACDTFQGHARVDSRFDTVHAAADKFLDTSVRDVREYLSSYRNLVVVEGDIFLTAERFASIPSWGMVHVDVDVYPATDFCLRTFGPRLAPGAFLIVDDYGFLTCPGSKRAVDDFIKEQTQFRMLHLITGQAVVWRSS